MYVRLAAAWTDPAGGVHGAGEVVDIDVVTLAELEEQGVVDNGEEGVGSPDWVGPGEDDTTQGWVGPGDEPGTDDDNEEAEDQADD